MPRDPIIVSEFPWSGRVATRLWITDRALDVFTEYQRAEQPPEHFLKKLKRYCTNGFANYIGETNPIRHEWGGVFRIGDGGLFRLLAFFDGKDQSRFIVIDAYQKRGQKLGKSDRDRIDEVADVKRTNAWRYADQP